MLKGRAASKRIDFKAIKFKYVSLVLLLIAALLIYFLYLKSGKIERARASPHAIENLIQKPMGKAHSEFSLPVTWKFRGRRLVHLDLKGAPLRVTYYAQLFPLLSKMGATGVVIEYDDMFPYSKTLQNLTALNAYTIQDIRKINSLAHVSNLEIVPLVQTFDHLELLLKLEQYYHLREVPEFPSTICPSIKDSEAVLEEMLYQIIDAHNNSKVIHVGADEVTYLGACNRCRQKMKDLNLSKDDLYIKHIKFITNIIHKKYPDLTVLIWDDMLRSLPLNLLEDIKNEPIVPVIWKYSRDVYNELGPSLWDMYSGTFDRIWIASAFKGVTGPTQYIPELSYHTENHKSWMSTVREYRTKFKFEGIILTGQQRYDHFGTLCELLPVAIPTLAMNLRVVMGYNDSPLSPPREVAKLLGCSQPYGLLGTAFGSPRCSFPGSAILEQIHRFHQLKTEFDRLLSHPNVKGWLNDYNIKHEFSNPQKVSSVSEAFVRLHYDLLGLDVDLTEALSEVYDEYVVDEWKETYLLPFKSKVSYMSEAIHKILTKSSWSKRPLKHLKSVTEL